MQDIPPGPPPGPFGVPGRPFPFPVPKAPEPVEFTDEQKRHLAAALYEAETAVLQAIARSAGHDDASFAARTTLTLTHALAMLRVAAGQASSASPFFPGPPPWVMGPDMSG